MGFKLTAPTREAQSSSSAGVDRCDGNGVETPIWPRTAVTSSAQYHLRPVDRVAHGVTLDTMPLKLNFFPTCACANRTPAPTLDTGTDIV